MKQHDVNHAANVFVRRLIGELDTELEPKSGADWKAIFDRVQCELDYHREKEAA